MPARKYDSSAHIPASATPTHRLTISLVTGPADPSASSRQKEGGIVGLGEIIAASILPYNEVPWTRSAVGRAK
jgi:hypothetical protein